MIDCYDRRNMLSSLLCMETVRVGSVGLCIGRWVM